MVAPGGGAETQSASPPNCDQRCVTSAYALFTDGVLSATFYAEPGVFYQAVVVTDAYEDVRTQEVTLEAALVCDNAENATAVGLGTTHVSLDNWTTHTVPTCAGDYGYNYDVPMFVIDDAAVAAAAASEGTLEISTCSPTTAADHTIRVFAGGNEGGAFCAADCLISSARFKVESNCPNPGDQGFVVYLDDVAVMPGLHYFLTVVPTAHEQSVNLTIAVLNDAHSAAMLAPDATAVFGTAGLPPLSQAAVVVCGESLVGRPVQ